MAGTSWAPRSKVTRIRANSWLEACGEGGAGEGGTGAGYVTPQLFGRTLRRASLGQCGISQRWHKTGSQGAFVHLCEKWRHRANVGPATGSGCAVRGAPLHIFIPQSYAVGAQRRAVMPDLVHCRWPSPDSLHRILNLPRAGLEREAECH